MKRLTMALLAAGLLAGCLPESEEEVVTEAPVRGLKTVLIADSEDSTVRRYPSVLQPSELTVVAFETPGKIGSLALSVGQTVAAGEVLAQLDDTDLKIQIASAEAAVEQARVTAQNATDALERAEDLFERGTITRVALDNTRTEAVAQQQVLLQAERSLDSARERLGDTALTAPFDGTISSVDTQPFATVGAGTPVATLYREGTYEVSFTVNFDTVSQMVVGKPAKLVLADDPSRVLDAVVTELGSRAETVASFPVVISTRDAPDFVRAGMAVEVQLEFPLPAVQGYAVPISAAVFEGTVPDDVGPGSPAPISVFVFDPQSETVRKRSVTLGGVRENQLLIIDGLEPGERVASAGVSFLSDGMKVKLVE